MKLNELKESGEAPDFLTEEGLQTLINGYLLKDETPKQMYKRVAKAAANYYPSLNLEDKFFDIMWKNWLCPASPVLSNMGTNRGLPISCNSIHVDDSINSIFMKSYELAVLSKNGAGVGIYFGDLRGRGAKIKDNGTSEGVVPWAKIFDQTTISVSQGCYDDQTELLTENGWKLFEDLTPGTKVAQSTNKGEISFVDFTDYIKYHVDEDLVRFNNEVNSIDLLVTKNHRMAIKFGTNNYLEIIEANEFSPNIGNTFYTIIEHYINDLTNNKPDKYIKYITGDIVNKSYQKYIGNVYCVTVPSGILVVRRKGTVVLCGNSTRRGASAIYLPIDHLDIEEFINIRRPTGDINRRCLNIHHGVCITNEWMESLLGGDIKKRAIWENLLRNRVETGEPYIFFTDNVNQNNPECYKQNNLNVKTSNICCLSGETLIATKNGPKRIDSILNQDVKIFDGNQWVPNNKFELKGHDKLIRIHLADGSYVDSNSNHRWFIIKNNELYTTFTKDLQINDCLESKETKSIKIIKIENIIGLHPVYCTTVETTGKFALANGLMTGNSEITLYTDPDHTFVCCLSSLNLIKFDEWKNTDTVQLTVKFLDAVLSEYIKKTETMKGMEASRNSAIKGRAIGIGVLGFHTLLQERNIPLDSFDAMQLNAEIFKTIRTSADIATKELAKELGEPEWCKGFGIRNTHLLAIAPTVSNSIISGGYSAGIEPITANIFVQKSAKGTFIKKNATLERLLESKGKNTSEVWKSINEQNGSVQHLSYLSKLEKEIFLTAREVNQFTLIKMAAQRQRWIDQGQSLNLFFAMNSDPKYIHEVHLAAWKSGLKTLYYLRSDGVIKGDLASRSEDECKACEG